MQVEFVLPWPPSVNRLWRMGKGNWYSTKVALDFKEHVHYLVFKARQPRFDPAARLRLDIYAYPPDRRARDIDNLSKVVQDALQDARVFANDAQIDQLWIERMEIVRGGELRVRLQSLN